MALDPSIALQAGQGMAAPQNPLDTFGKVVGVANAVGQNKLQGQALETQQQGLAATRLKALGAIAGTALRAYDPANPASAGGVVDALHMGIDAAVKNGTLDQGTAQQLFSGIAATKSPQDLIGRVQQFALMGIDPNAALSRIYGQPGSVSDGQTVQPGVVRDPMMGGGFQGAGQGIPQFPTRDALNERVVIGYDAKGNPIYGPKAQVTPPALGGPVVTPPSPFGDGRLPPALRNPANAPPPVTGNVVAPGPAAVSAQTATGSQSATAFQNYADTGLQAQGQAAILANMQTEAAQFTQGPGQERIKNFQAAALRFAAPLAAAFGIDEKSVAANQSFDKLAAQIADAQGAKSDARLQVTQAANPSSALTPAGVDLILKQLVGNTDYLRARADLAAKWPDKADREGFEAQVGKNLDPRAFQFERLDAEQKRTFLANIKDPKDKAAFQRGYFWARDQGLIGAPR